MGKGWVCGYLSFSFSLCIPFSLSLSFPFSIFFLSLSLFTFPFFPFVFPFFPFVSFLNICCYSSFFIYLLFCCSLVFSCGLINDAESLVEFEQDENCESTAETSDGQSKSTRSVCSEQIWSSILLEEHPWLKELFLKKCKHFFVPCTQSICPPKKKIFFINLSL